MSKYRIFDKDKFTKVGNVIITDDGIASGFSANNYINTGFIVDLTKPNQEFEICISTTGDNQTGVNKWLISTKDRSFGLNYNVNNKIDFSYNLTGGITYTKTIIYPTVLKANTTYFAKISTKFNSVRLYVREEKNEYSTYVEGELPTSMATNQFLCLGYHYPSSSAGFNGSIDLKQFSITVNGVEVFAGSHEITVNEQMLELIETKNRIKNAIIKQGGIITADTPFREYADKISNMATIPPFQMTNNTGLSILSGNGGTNAHLFSDNLLIKTRSTTGYNTITKDISMDIRDVDIYVKSSIFPEMPAGGDSYLVCFFNQDTSDQLYVMSYPGAEIRIGYYRSGSGGEEPIAPQGCYNFNQPYIFKYSFNEDTVDMYISSDNGDTYTLLGTAHPGSNFRFGQYTYRIGFLGGYYGNRSIGGILYYNNTKVVKRSTGEILWTLRKVV